MENDITTGEVWLDVPNYEGLYMVSNLGNVKSLNRDLGFYRNGKPKRRSGKVLKPQIIKDYYAVSLGKAGVIKIYRVHRLVALAFVPGRTKKKWVTNHKNGKKLDNRADNLEWCSPSDNLSHAYNSGLRTRKIRRSASIDARKAKSIKRLALDGARTGDIAKAHNVSTGIVRHIKAGRTWKYITA